jgi:protease-4
VTRARSLSPSALNDYVADAPAALAAVNGDAAKLAMQRGLVTALKSRRQLADDLKSIVGEDPDSHSFNSIGMSQYLSAIRSKLSLKPKSDSKIGIVVAAGEILDGHQPPGKIGGESTADLLRQARYDKAVKAVVLRVDSPGGSMFASELILREVQALRKAGKPVVVSMSTYAASGGYYISAAANQIFASPTTLTGSIGVFSVVPTFERTLEKIGVKVDGLGTTPLAGALRLDRPLDDASRRILQSSVDHAYDEFLHRVGEGRKKSPEDVDKIAQGRVWAGVDAQRIGLVDHLGGLKDAIDAAAKLGELGSNYDVDYIEPELSLREELLMQLRSEIVHVGRMAGLFAPEDTIERALDPIVQRAQEIAELNDPRGLYAYCWCEQPSGRVRMLAVR